MAELLDHQLRGVGVDDLIDVGHHAHFHQHFDDVGAALDGGAHRRASAEAAQADDRNRHRRFEAAARSRRPAAGVAPGAGSGVGLDAKALTARSRRLRLHSRRPATAPRSYNFV